MESKKINQLATELTPSLSDLTIIGDPSTGISKKITLSQMASLFTGTVEEYASLAAFPLVGVADTIYIALDTNVLYRWDTGTNAYVELSPNIINSLVFNDANGFDGTISLVGSVATLTITTALTTGSVGFIGASGALLQDNANFFWDDTNNRLGLGTNAPTTALDVFGSGIIGRLNGTSTNNAFLGFASAGTNKWSIGNVQSDHRFRIYNDATTSELVSVLQTGEFGIGIANPTTKLHIDGGASALIANLDANVSVAKSVSFRSDNSNRFNIEVSGTESGSNAGANFFIRRYSDAGSLIDTPLTITRSTGAISLAGALSGTSSSFSSTVTTITFIANQANGGQLYFQTAGVNTGLLTNTNLISGTGSNIDLNAYVYGNNSFGIWTNTFRRFTIDGGGNVAIGIDTANGKLHLSGNTPSQIVSIIENFDATQTGGTRLSFRYQGTETGYIYNRFNGANFNTDIGSADYMRFLIQGSEKLRITTAGNVGIGTGIPLQLLYLQGSPIANNVFSGIGIGDSASERIRIGYNTLGIITGLVPPQIIAGVSNLFLATRDIGGADMVFQTGAGVTEKARITSGGSVLINTQTDNGFKLEVNGTARLPIISSQNGSVLTDSNVATTLFTINAYGLWTVYVDLPAGSGSPANYSAYVIVSNDGSTARILEQTDGLNLFVTLSGNNLQARQTSGGQFNIRFVYQRIAV
jgi:hypothetical protein